jgi:hypothetical protein
MAGKNIGAVGEQVKIAEPTPVMQLGSEIFLYYTAIYFCNN